MKNFNPLTIAVFAVSLFFSVTSFSQSQSATDNAYYVVIGAFANPRNAAEFTENAKRKNMDARSTLIDNPRKLHYVYILETPDKDNAVSLAVKLQKESTYSDAWVYSNILTNNPVAVKIEKEEMVEETKKIGDSTIAEVKQPVAESIKPTDGSKPFVFKIRSIDTGFDVAGDVDLFDADIIKGRKLVSYRGNDVVNVKPVNKSGNLLLVCDVFGYRKVQLPVNFNEPKIEDAVSMADGNVVVTFDLARLKKGDKVIMYNVYFFNHAAILRPESQFEVNALLEFLKEKPTSRIKIHGHANGNDFGDIITLGNSKDYFSLSSENTKGKGSVTKLSEERARIIQSYLVKEGIDIKRMELKAWGGKVPIYDEDHSLAHANVRVEVEILEE
jgi:outer membrane protein OmpA-like peptidoglycan-associated protein